MGEWPKPLTEEEKQFMRQNCEVLTLKDMAEKIGRAEVTVRKFLQNAGLLKKGTRRPYEKSGKVKQQIEPDVGSIVHICHQALEPLAPEERKRAITALRALFGLLMIEPTKS